MPPTDEVVRVIARSVDDAVRRASLKLSVAPSLLDSEVVGARKSGWFGFGEPKLEVLVWVRDGIDLPEGEPDEAAPPIPERRPTPPSGWRVWCAAGECYLEVTRASVTLEDIEDHIRAWPFDEYQREAVRGALSATGSAPVRIGRFEPPAPLAEGAKLFVKPSPDNLEAWAVPAAGGIAGEDDLREALATAGVTTGIDEAAIKAAAGRELSVPLLLARGTEATPSRDAAVEYLFSEEENALRPRIREDGSVDYRDLKPMHTVQEGAVIGRYLPAVEGEPGRDVFGRTVEPAQAPRKTPPERFAGNDVVVAENGIDYIAKRAGRPVRDGARIELVDVYMVMGDVDYSTGNIDFRGEVYVSGDVQPGFSVKATGNVRIDGLVDSGNVTSGKDLLIGGGIQGHGESKIVCGGEMSARFIDAAEVVCDGDLLVISTIVRGSITAAGHVNVIGRGSIVGGKVKAAAGISCSSAGSPAGVATSLEVDWLGSLKPGANRERELARHKAARIVVHGDVYPGTVVTVNGAKFPVRDRLRAVAFQAADRGIALSPAG